MKNLKSYKLFESKKMDDLATCLYDLTDIGFEPEEDGLDQTKEVKRTTRNKSEDNLVMALKLVRSVQGDKFYGHFSGTFTKDEFLKPTIINPNYDKKEQRTKFTKYESDLLTIIEDSVNKIMNLYLKNASHGDYSINQYSVIYGTCVVILLKFYK